VEEEDEQFLVEVQVFLVVLVAVPIGQTLQEQALLVRDMQEELEALLVILQVEVEVLVELVEMVVLVVLEMEGLEDQDSLQQFQEVLLRLELVAELVLRIIQME
jgi:hypothetical protein